MFILRAHVNHDSQCIEVTTDRWQPGLGWHEHKDFVYTQPNGDWTNLKFMRWEQVHYIDFLKTMVQNNLEVTRKIALLTTHIPPLYLLISTYDADGNGNFSKPCVNSGFHV